MVDLLDCLHLRLNGRVFRLRLLVSLKRRSLESSSRLAFFFKFSSSLSVFDGSQRRRRHGSIKIIIMFSFRALFCRRFARIDRSLERKRKRVQGRDPIFKIVREREKERRGTLFLYNTLTKNTYNG